MEFTGVHLVSSPPQLIWRALHSPSVMARLLPGCTEFQPTDSGVISVSLDLRVDRFPATFSGKVHLTDIREPESYRMTAEMNSPALGDVSGSAMVYLKRAGGRTEFHYTVTAKLGHKLAHLGSTLLGEVARQLAEDFFVKLEMELGTIAEAEWKAAHAQRTWHSRAAGRLPFLVLAALAALLALAWLLTR